MLSDEIEKTQRLVRTDAYQMSIGEIVSMYDNGEISIDPEFQRLFRWDIGQKSKLIESLLLGIPIPSIFVFEKENGSWELIDGLQRVSTILEFMGRLRSPDQGLHLPSVLEATKYLPSLHNAVWEVSDRILDVAVADQNPIEKSLQLSIRRSRLSVEILKRPSDDQTKYDLFQRLNAGGTLANAQELRNCIMLMINGDYFRAVKTAAEQPAFQEVISVSEDQLEKQRHVEMAVRFLVHTHVPYDGKLDVEEYIDEGIVSLAQAGRHLDARNLIDRTFTLLDEVAGKNALRRFENGAHVGKVGLVGLEGIAVGVAKNLDAILALGGAAVCHGEDSRLLDAAAERRLHVAGHARYHPHPAHCSLWTVLVPSVSKPYTETDFSTQITEDRNWRIREISDLKAAARLADKNLQRVLLRALVTICYAHWEGYVRFAAKKYLEHVALRKFQYGQLGRQFLRNYFLPRLAALSASKAAIAERCAIVDEILNSSDHRFSRVNEDLVNTKANLNFDVFTDICLVCGVPVQPFAGKSTFIDVFLLKRRNAIAHGEDTLVAQEDLDELSNETIGLMRAFGDALENHVVLHTYKAA